MSVLEGISKAGAKIFGFLDSGVKQGLTANSILTALQDEGLGYRRTTFLSDIRILTEAEETWSTIRYVGRDKTPSERHYITVQMPMLEQYQTVVELRGYNVETGEAETRHVTIHHDTLLTRRELEEDALKESQEVSPKFIIEAAMPVQARKSPFEVY